MAYTNLFVGTYLMYHVEQISNVCKTFFNQELTDIPLIKGILFEIISPFSALGYSNAGMKSMNLNRMSIGMVIQLYSKDNAHYFLYTGDMDKDTISMLLCRRDLGEMHIPDYYDYIKIPHHGSKASEEILKILSADDKSEVAAATVFKPQNLPDEDLLNGYRDKAVNVLRTDQYEDGIIRNKYILVP